MPMNILYETEQLIFEHDYEMAWLKLKISGEVLLEEFFYGEPMCGLIDVENKWAVVAGDHVTVWTLQTSKIIKHEDLGWVHALRVKDQDTIEILIDPWSDKSAIFELNISTLLIKKVSDFVDYWGQEYSDTVIW